MARDVVDESGADVVETAKRERAERRGPFGRIGLFLRQVGAELRKVVRPTRRELVSYTIVVLVFVVIMMALVYGLDTLFAFLVNWAFGSSAVFGG